MLTEEQKAEIDALSFEQLSDELLMELSSRFRGEAREYVVARYSRLDHQRNNEKHREMMELQGKRVRIAEEANKLSKIAVWIATLAFLIAFLSLVSDFKRDGMVSSSHFNPNEATSPPPVK